VPHMINTTAADRQLGKNHMLNAFITILSSRVILNIKMQKQVVIPKDII